MGIYFFSQNKYITEKKNISPYLYSHSAEYSKSVLIEILIQFDGIYFAGLKKQKLAGISDTLNNIKVRYFRGNLISRMAIFPFFAGI